MSRDHLIVILYVQSKQGWTLDTAVGSGAWLQAWFLALPLVNYVTSRFPMSQFSHL